MLWTWISIAGLIFVLGFGLMIAVIWPDRRGWRTYLSSHGAFISGWIAAEAMVATVGSIVYTVQTQHDETSRTIEAQRSEADRSRLVAKQSLAAGLSGEICNIAIEAADAELLRTMVANVQTVQDYAKLHAGRKLGETVDVPVRLPQPNPDFAIVYRSKVGKIGTFPLPFPQRLTRFYNIYFNWDHMFGQLVEEYHSKFVDMTYHDILFALDREIEIQQILGRDGPILASDLAKVTSPDISSGCVTTAVARGSIGPAGQQTSVEDQIKSQCSSVSRNEDGSWTIVGEFRLTSPTGSVSMGTGNKLTRDERVLGVPIAGTLDKLCRPGPRAPS